MSSDNIQSVLTEKRVFPPPADFIAQASLNAEKLAVLHAAAARDYVSFWADRSDEKL